jgi:hypothetical protein
LSICARSGIDYKFPLLWQRRYHDNIPLTWQSEGQEF